MDGQVIVRLLQTEKDIEQLGLLAQSFINESLWPYTYSKEISDNRFRLFFYNEDTDVILVEKNGIVIGAAEVAYDHEHSVERVGYLCKFYISPAGRKTSAGARLIKACNDWFDKNGCVNTFATATAHIPELGRAFNNLLEKNGYEVCADTLVRKINVQSKKSN